MFASSLELEIQWEGLAGSNLLELCKEKLWVSQNYTAGEWRQRGQHGGWDGKRRVYIKHMPEIRVGHLRCSVQFSRSVVSNSLRPHEPQHARPPCPSTPRVHPNPCPLSRCCRPTISSSVVPFSCPQSFQHQGLFQWVSSLPHVAKSGSTKDISVADSIPGSGRCPRGKGGNPLQYYCLENPMAGYSPWGHKELDTSEVN